ncbi:MAG TPA: hypothetical protein ENK24_05510 [Anaerolineae bacterium]|nr:hypothetical protein [Anaerolineae bacterium]
MAAEKRGVIRVKRSATSVNFGIDLALKTPLNRAGNPVNIIKALLDGIISAFHAHNGVEIDEVSQRLARQLGKDKDEIRRLLSGQKKAILGERRLLKPFRRGVQWNPADDRLVYCRVLLERNEGMEQVICSGKIFEVEGS